MQLCTVSLSVCLSAFFLSFFVCTYKTVSQSVKLKPRLRFVIVLFYELLIYHLCIIYDMYIYIYTFSYVSLVRRRND